jgi:predicted nucleotidyltransferase component of viral defense system
MNIAIAQMLERYQCQTESDYTNALREIMQEIALLGLWRGKFFEHAAFYGGTALRIIYGLERSSEDLDFSLLTPNPQFRLKLFGDALKRELESFGFSVEFSSKEKKLPLNIDSAFLKTNTKLQLISIGLGDELARQIHSKRELKIKLEVDIDPPPEFKTESKTLLLPIPHAVRVYTLPNLLAGKLHAVLCRKWLQRSKGRDWYDMVWYAGHYPKVNLKHLEVRMRQSGNYPDDTPLTLERLHHFLSKAVAEVDIAAIKQDVMPFIHDQQTLELWSKDFFEKIIKEFIQDKDQG